MIIAFFIKIQILTNVIFIIIFFCHFESRQAEKNFLNSIDSSTSLTSFASVGMTHK